MIDLTLLHRQVNPSWIQQGRVTSRAFKPTPKDKSRLSVYDGDQVTAHQAWSHYTGELGFASIGVLAVTVSECAKIELVAKLEPESFPAHAVIRFDTCTTIGQIEKKAKRLTTTAVERGWQHRAETGK